MINSIYSVIKTTKVEETARFYETLLGFTRTFSADWYVSMKNGNFELGILDPHHESIPVAFRGKTSNQSLLLSIEIDEVDEFYKKFKDANVKIHLELRDEPWGQRHFIAEDPNGLPIDMIKVIPPSEEFFKQYQ